MLHNIASELFKNAVGEEDTLEVPEYDVKNGIKLEWDEGFNISVDVKSGEVTISANKAGLRSLARQLMTLAQENVPMGCHIHLDEFNSLEEGSSQLILERV